MVGSLIKTLCCVGLLLQASVALASAPETLSYRVYYKGLLSAMQELPIAEARLVTEQADDGRLEISTLSLSSAAHDVVDTLYPIRYRLRSLYDLRDQRLLGMERFKRTREVKHDLAWLDADHGLLHYLKADANASEVRIPGSLQPWLAKGAVHGAERDALAVPDQLLDRLTLLQTLRRHIPALGEVQRLPVTDGPKTYRYQVRLDGTETLSLAGRRWDTWRLRVEGYETTVDGRPSDEPDHAPIYVWISRDPARLPLQFRIDHAVGDFTVAWVPDRLPVDLAMDVPAAPVDPWSDEG